MGDRFLTRWSRRKARARVAPVPDAPDMPELATEEPAAEAAPVHSDSPCDSSREKRASAAQASVSGVDSGVDSGADAAPEGEPAPEPGEEEMEDEARELGLPSPRTLGPGSDFKAFMASDVPDHLRRFALRRLWRSNPILANVDGLVDYGEDFTDAGTVIEGMKTAYQVGKGYFRDETDVDSDEENGLPDGDEGAVADAECSRDAGKTDAGKTDGDEDHLDDAENIDDDSDSVAEAVPPDGYATTRITTHAESVTKT